MIWNIRISFWFLLSGAEVVDNGISVSNPSPALGTEISIEGGGAGGVCTGWTDISLTIKFLRCYLLTLRGSSHMW